MKEWRREERERDEKIDEKIGWQKNSGRAKEQIGKERAREDKGAVARQIEREGKVIYEEERANGRRRRCSTFRGTRKPSLRESTINKIFSLEILYKFFNL